MKAEIAQTQYVQEIVQNDRTEGPCRIRKRVRMKRLSDPRNLRINTGRNAVFARLNKTEKLKAVWKVAK